MPSKLELIIEDDSTTLVVNIEDNPRLSDTIPLSTTIDNQLTRNPDGYYVPPTSWEDLRDKPNSTTEEIDDAVSRSEQNASSIEGLEQSKVDKVVGKELSSNDFTDQLRDKLENFDDSLRDDLANPDMGAAMVASTVITVKTIEQLRSILNPEDGRIYKTTGFYFEDDGRGAAYRFDASSFKQHNGTEFIRPLDLLDSQPGRFILVSMDSPILGISPLASVVVSSPSSYRVLGQIGSRIYGRLIGDEAHIHVSDDGARTWTVHCPASSLGSASIAEAGDGEALLIAGKTIRKSSGFSTDPMETTWSTVLDGTGLVPENGAIQPFGYSGCGLKHIVNMYWSNWPDNEATRLAWISLDGGSTWAIAYDSNAEHGVSDGHAHGVCYDPWDDAFYVIEGHSTFKGVYRSHDDGNTWNKIHAEVVPGNYPTTIVAIDNGLILASDANVQRGLHIIKRPVDRTDWQSMSMEFFYEIQDNFLLQSTGIIGFGAGWHRDPATGVVWIGWRNSQAPHPFLTATDGRHAALVYVEHDEIGSAANPGIGEIFSYRGEIGFTVTDGTGSRVKSARGKANYMPDITRSIDPGRMYGGNARVITGENTNTSIGPGSWTNGRRNVAIGDGATVGSSQADVNSVAIGHGAKTHLSQSVAIGGLAECLAGGSVNIGANTVRAENSIAIGRSADSGPSPGSVAIGVRAEALSFANTVVGYEASGVTVFGARTAGQCAVGYQAKAGVANSVAIGHNANSAGSSGTVAIGSGSEAGGVGTIAIGHNAAANPSHSDAVALGRNTETQRANSVCVGPRDIESTKAGSRIFLRSPNGTTYAISVSDAGELEVVAV